MPEPFTRRASRSRRYREQASKFVRYGAVSAICTVLSLVGLAVLVGGLSASPGWSNVGIVVCFTPFSFELNRRWVWSRQPTERRLRFIGPFFAFSLGGLALSTISVRAAGSLGTHWSRPMRTAAVEAANLMAFGMLWVVQYVVLDRIVFSQSASPEAPMLFSHRRDAVISGCNTALQGGPPDDRAVPQRH